MDIQTIVTIVIVFIVGVFLGMFFLSLVAINRDHGEVQKVEQEKQKIQDQLDALNLADDFFPGIHSKTNRLHQLGYEMIANDELLAEKFSVPEQIRILEALHILLEHERKNFAENLDSGQEIELDRTRDRRPTWQIIEEKLS